MSNEIQAVPEAHAPALASQDPFLMMIERVALDPRADVGKLTALLDLQERVLSKQAETEADQAFARVCAQMPRVTKNSMIDFGKGKPIPYAKFEDIDAAIRSIYQGEGFTLTFDTEPSAQTGWTTYHAILIHQNGNKRRSSISLPLDTSGGKQNIQGAGSSSSYGVRYATKNLFNIVFENEDDDGKFASTSFIDAVSVAKLEALITETKTELSRFLEAFQASALENIQTKDFARAVDMLTKKKAKMQQGSTAV